MYVPDVFREDDIVAMHQLMVASSIATIVSKSADGLVASHVPVEVDGVSGGQGVIRFHMAKPNQHHSTLLDGGEVLAIFQGPQAYLTPSWYPTKKATGKVVPTLNYAAVHAYGTARRIDDPDLFRNHLEALTDHFEEQYATPWAVSDAPADYIDRLMKMIVGIEMTVDRLEGKWKMSQNKFKHDRQGVALGYRSGGNEEMANLVEAYDPER